VTMHQTLKNSSHSALRYIDIDTNGKRTRKYNNNNTFGYYLHENDNTKTDDQNAV
jgi:hypothetical protein